MSAFGIVGQMFAPIPKELPITSSITPTSTLDPAAAQYLAQHVARVKLKAAEDSYKWQSQNKILSKKKVRTHERRGKVLGIILGA